MGRVLPVGHTAALVDILVGQIDAAGKAVWLSIIQNLRWSRLFMRMEITGLKRLSSSRGMPVSASNFLA